MADQVNQRNAANQREVKQAAKTQRQIETQQHAELRELLKDEKFRRFMWRVLGFCGIEKHGFDEVNPHKTSFNMGMRNVGLFVQAQIVEARPEALLQMMQEPRITETE